MGFDEIHRIQEPQRAIATDSWASRTSRRRTRRSMRTRPAASRVPQRFRHGCDLATKPLQPGGKHFDIPDPIKKIECCIARPRRLHLLHRTPPRDFSRPGRWVGGTGGERYLFHLEGSNHSLPRGRTWPSPPDRAKCVPVRAAESVAAQALLCSGHGEGWALYAERLMDDLG